ncbi:MAG: hypothetical protein DRJ37_02385 [Thermoprotei archaeon]|nr:MAG: hypothetical protein DRJ37_02385 [Thermoprotei archaeon]
MNNLRLIPGGVKVPIDSSSILKSLGYDFYTISERGVEPELADITFKDLIPEFANASGHAKAVAEKRLYKHQYEAFKALLEGKNVILRSGTGSGKTEAWLVYSIRKGVKALVLYPTLALANDQINRIRSYAQAVGIPVDAIDAKRREEFYKRGVKGSKLREYMGSLQILITNPAFLLMDLKRYAVESRSTVLSKVIPKVQLVVVDELDFYSPREIALLLSMIKILKTLSPTDFQIAILTATLGNPEELGVFLTKINGRKTAVIYGKAFKVPNRTFLVLGKNLKQVWNAIRKYKEAVASAPEIGKDVLESLEDFELFKENFYKVLEVLDALGLESPRVELEPTEILEKYLNDEGVTLIFTRSIAKAEELARKLRHKLSEESVDRIATHHHLVSKVLREKIEQGAREGRVKLIFTPRTLAQGIDIGTVIRIVHIGLPDDVREYHQREGRKGRRREISFTESIIFPLLRWDRELLTRGVSVFKSWLELPLEHVIVNPDNKYSLLFEALFKFVSPILRKFLSKDEYKFLEKLGLVKEGELTRRGKKAWTNLNFYEFSPPYGIKRIKVRYGEENYLEDISFCDLVEKFQPGCIDYTEDAIVTQHRLGGKSGRVVTAVIEEPLSERVIWSNDALAYAYEEYRKAKYRWGEEPGIFKDYVTGRLHSEVICVVHPPLRGFGIYTKIPNRVQWILRGRKSRLIPVDGKTLVIRNLRIIEVPTGTYGKYNDYTYGLSVELDPGEDLKWLRIGLALLMVVLRVEYQIAFETIMYDLAKVGEKKLMILHEPESAGLLEKMDWLEVMKKVEKFEPDNLTEVLLQVVDEDAHLEFVASGLRWDIAKQAAVRALNYLLLREKIALKIKDREVYVPRPSRALKIAVVDVLTLPLDDEGRVALIAAGVYDGEEFTIRESFKEFYIVGREVGEIEDKVRELLNKDFIIGVYGLNDLLHVISESGLTSFTALLLGLKQMGKIVDVKEEAIGRFEVDRLPLEEVESALGWERTIHLQDIRMEWENTRRYIRDKPYSKWISSSRYLQKKISKYIEENLEAIYKLHLVLSSL